MKEKKRWYEKYPSVFTKQGGYNPSKLHLVSNDDLETMKVTGVIYGDEYDDADNTRKQIETEINTELEKYKMAYETMTEYSWECLPKETKKAINKELNRIFGKGHSEYVEEG